MAMDEHLDEVLRPFKDLAESVRELKQELRDALRDLNGTKKDPRERKTEAISVLKDQVILASFRQEIASQHRLCTKEVGDTVDARLKLFQAEYINPISKDVREILERLCDLESEIGALCNDIDTTSKAVENGHTKTTSTMGSIKEQAQDSWRRLFGYTDDKGNETTGLIRKIQLIEDWLRKHDDAEEKSRKDKESKKGDFRYWIEVILKILFWAGPFVISIISLWHTLSKITVT